MSYSDVMGYAKDQRNIEQLAKNIAKGNILARKAMLGLKVWYKHAKGIELAYQLYEDSLWKEGEDYHSHQDADIITPKGNFPIEIKSLLDSCPSDLDIRVTSSLIEHKNTGFLYITEPKRFTLIPLKKVMAIKSEVGGRWNKRIIKINRDDYAWKGHYYDVFDGWLEEYKRWLASYHNDKQQRY